LRDLSWIGIWLLVLGAVAIVVEGALVSLWSLRLARRGIDLSARLTLHQAQLRSDAERLRASLDEMEMLWQPYRRLLRWLRHPLTIALMQSLMRRLAATR
jgi:hypothetical protein